MQKKEAMPAYAPVVFGLPNGMKVVVEEVPDNEIAAIQFWVKAGSADELEKEAGIAHVLEHMAFKGSEKVPGSDFAGRIESLGGYINAFTSSDNTVYHITIHRKHLEEVVKILSDVIISPLIAPEELEKELEVILEEWKRGEDIPEVRLYKEFFYNAYSLHPYRNPTIGTPETISSFKRESLINFMKKWYTPQNSFLVVAGGVKSEDVFEIAKKYFGRWEGEGVVRARPPEPPQEGMKTFVVKGNFMETKAMIGFHTVDMNHPDAPVLDVLSSIFTQLNSSRLYAQLYLKKNLVHDIFSYSYTPLDSGMFIIGFSLDGKNLEPAIKEVIKEITNLPWTLTEEDLVNARTATIKGYLHLNEKVDSLARELGFFTSFAGDPSAINKYIKAIMDTTAEDIKKVAKKYFLKRNMTAGVILEKGMEGVDENLIRRWIEEVWIEGFEKEIKEKRTLKDGITRFQLKNGALVLTKQTPGTGIINISIYLKGGLLYEPQEKVGISNFIARTLLRGTESFNQDEIAKKLDEIGGSFSASSGHDAFVINMSFLKGFEERGMGLLMEILLNPAFPAEEIEKVRRQIIDDIKTREDYLPSVARDLLNEGLYKNHPYRFNSLGTEESVLSITREDLANFWKRMLAGRNMVAGSTGDFGGDFEHLLIEGFSRIKEGEKLEKKVPSPLPPSKLEEKLKHIDRNQVHIFLGFLTVPINHTDTYPLIVLDGILSGQGGRIFRELRDERALAYALTAISFRSSEPGYISVYLACDPSKYEEALRGIREILDDLIKNGVKKEEVERAKNMITGNYWINLQTGSAKAEFLARNEFYELGFQNFRDYEKRINDVKVEDVNRIIKKFILPDRYVLSAAGNLKKGN